MTPRRRVALGVAVLGAWAWHTAGHVLEGHAAEALWCCIVGELLLALGLLAARPGLVAAGALWLAFGLPLFFVSVAAGEPKTAASWVTHLFGPLAAVVGVRGVGFPRGTWWRAALGLLGLQALTRLVTPAVLNVNLACAVYPGWEHVFPSYPVYEAFLLALGATTFGVAEVAARRWLVAAPDAARAGAAARALDGAAA